MIAVHIFSLKNYATLYVVSTPEAISDLCVFAENHQNRGDLTADALTKRILFHNAYCCVVPETLSGRLSSLALTKELKKNDRLIDLDAYVEAYLLASPEEAASALTFPTEELIKVVEESAWCLLFKVDRDDVIERLRKTEKN